MTLPTASQFGHPTIVKLSYKLTEYPNSSVPSIVSNGGAKYTDNVNAYDVVSKL